MFSSTLRYRSRPITKFVISLFRPIENGSGTVSGKNAFVTGGGSGIGLAVVQRFLAAGAHVIVADLRVTPEFKESDAEFVKLDVTDEAAVAQRFGFAEAQLGKLDIVVNNAGIGLEEKRIVDADIDVFEKTLQVNLKGVLFGLKYAPKHMNDGGSIINTASLAATLTIPEYTGYAVSKAGVVKLTQQAAVELGARGIRVNAVCPGTTTTPMEPADSDESAICAYTTALGRPGLPEEQAAVFHFLASDDSSYVNAQAINVDGGWVNGISYALKDKLVGWYYGPEDEVCQRDWQTIPRAIYQDWWQGTLLVTGVKSE